MADQWQHQVMGVFDPDGEDPPFCYTVGRSLLGRPELYVSGLHPGLGTHLLNQLTLVDDEVPLEHGTLVDQIVGDYPVLVLRCDPKLAQMYQAVPLAPDGFDALQMVYPAVSGAFPPDPEYDLTAQHLGAIRW